MFYLQEGLDLIVMNSQAESILKLDNRFRHPLINSLWFYANKKLLGLCRKLKLIIRGIAELLRSISREGSALYRSCCKLDFPC